MSKSTAQQIEDLQNRLQALRTKKARQDRRDDTRQKIILGAEVAKILNTTAPELNANSDYKALVLGVLTRLDALDESEKHECIDIGRHMLGVWEKAKK
ncbi:conjugal transfer protein TraD [Pantoea dispersa]|uniref:conjugal transfer protein TraD n=1 Tax=Pantoea dispersa TaxID=59814 RepID=UPI0024AFDF4F|nr:conjugal transfer protein TraD [Pantoea dispersa]MDI6637258.1 conjugal transfer protein TraD [Pantoea dispersa]